MMQKRLFVVITLLSSMTACSFAPHYERPNSPVPPQLTATHNQLAQAHMVSWQSFYQDPNLQQLIQLTLQHNQDLRIAIANVSKAQAAYDISRGNIVPHINAYGESENTHANPALPISRINKTGVLIKDFELDLWGRLRNLSVAAQQQYLATIAGQKAVRQALIAQVAQTYYLWQNLQQQAHLTAQTVKARQKMWQLVQQQYQVGVGNALALQQAHAVYANAQAQYASVQRSMIQTQNALQLIVGTTIPAHLLAPQSFAQLQLPAIPANLASSVLLQRPDVIAAEAQLKAANANIGVARASFFPRIALTTAVGFISPQLSSLLDNDNRSWTVKPTVGLPLFNMGALWQQLKISKVDRQIAVAKYEKAIQTGFKEVADHLLTAQTYQQQLTALQQQSEAAKRAMQLAHSRYINGVDNFLQVQTADIAYYQAQQAYLQTQYESLLNHIQLYQALGGQWSSS